MNSRNIIVVFLGISLIVAGSVGAALASEVQYSVERIEKFAIPQGNLFFNSDFSKGFEGWQAGAGSGWDGIKGFDKVNYLTGGSSLFINDTSGLYGRFLQDVQVEPTKKYKLGFIFKMEDYGGAIAVGFYLKDTIGWVELNTKVATIGDAFLGGMKVSGWAAYVINHTLDGGEAKPFSGTMDWTKVEITLDLPALAKTLKVAPGGIVLIRGDLITSARGKGKFWLDSMYIYPVE